MQETENSAWFIRWRKVFSTASSLKVSCRCLGKILKQVPGSNVQLEENLQYLFSLSSIVIEPPGFSWAHVCPDKDFISQMTL